MGVGHKLIRSSHTSWDLFGGVGYVGTKFTDDTSRFVYRERLEWLWFFAAG